MLKSLINLIYPLRCQVCGVKLDPYKDGVLCEDCLGNIRRNRPPFCIKCGRSILNNTKCKQACQECISTKFYFERVWSVCVYEGVIKECIHLFKYKQRLCLEKPLSELMIDFKDHYININFDVVVPVPLCRRRLAEREFNQAEILAKNLAKSLGAPLVTSCLIKTKNTKPQSDLTRKQRFLNVAGAFSVKEPIFFYKKNILLIDDVITTGATINECAKVLTENGTRRVYGLTLARGL